MCLFSTIFVCLFACLFLCLFVVTLAVKGFPPPLSHQELLEIIANILGFIQNTLLLIFWMFCPVYLYGESNNSSYTRAIQLSSARIYGVPACQVLYWLSGDPKFTNRYVLVYVE